MNMFDEGLGYYEDENLGGLFSKLKKGLSKLNRKRKKITKKVTKAIRKITPKPLRGIQDNLEKLGRKLDKAGITKLAAGVALAFAGGPLVLGGLKAVGAKAALGTAGGLIKTGAGLAIKSGAVGQLVKTGLTLKAQQAASDAQEQANVEIANNLQVTKQIQEAIAQSPEFKSVVDKARSEGYTEEQILQHWVESKSYYAQAVPQVAQVIQPQIYAEARTQGFPKQFATDYSELESIKIAEDTVKKTQQNFNSTSLVPLIAGGVAIAFLTGAI